MTAAGVIAPRAGIGPIRPRPRPRELLLLGLVGAALVVGDLSLGLLRQGSLAGGLTLPDSDLVLAYLAALGAAHAAQVLAGRRSDQVILPVVGLLGGIGLLVMIRLPQGLVQQSFGGHVVGLAGLQAAWLVIAVAILATLGVVVRSDSWLRRYKYTWAAAGLVLLAATAVFGRTSGGATLDLRLGPISGQPSELLKVILVVFLAGYLSENRALLVEQSTRIGPVRLPPVPYLAPMLSMWAVALVLVVVQRDLGAAMLFYAVFLGLLYAATSRVSFIVLGLVLFAGGSWLMDLLFPVVRERVDIWLNPWADPLGSGYQVVQALYAFSRGGVVGTGLGAGLPLVNGQPPIPLVHSDFVFAAIGEELGLVGVLAVIALYLVLVERGLRIAASAADDFRALLAAGLTLVIGVQAFVIMAGNLKLIPVTGVTLPFIAYGGSSLVANAVVAGLLLALSDAGVEPPPPPRPRGRFGRGADALARRVGAVR